MGRRMLATALLAAATMLAAACGQTAGSSDGGVKAVAFDKPEAKETLGADDGFHGAIFYGAELMGSIDDCGCPGHPQGGLPWRLGYTEGFRAAYPDAGFLQVDAGNSMADIVDVNGKLYSDQNVKDEWVLKAFDAFHFDAANVSHHDIYYLSQFYKSADVYKQSLEKYPFLDRYVSANLEPEDPKSGVVAPPPYVVRTMTGKRVPGGSVRVAFVGLTENNPNLPLQVGYKVTAPEVALDRVIDKARSESDLVVVLYFASPEAASALAKRYGDKIAAFVVAHPKARESEAALTPPTNLVFARYQTRQLGELRLTLDGKKVASMTNRYVTLDDKLPKDDVAADMAAKAKEAFKQAQVERFNGGGNAPAPAPAGGQ